MILKQKIVALFCFVLAMTSFSTAGYISSTTPTNTIPIVMLLICGLGYCVSMVYVITETQKVS